MSSKHTPGPWTFDLENRDVVRTETGCNSILIAQLYKDSRTEANARLIAASPELLELLEKILTDKLKQPNGYAATFVQEIRVLVNKAKGGV